MSLLIMSAESRKCFDIYNILKPKVNRIYLCSDLGIFKRNLLSLIYFKKVFKTEKILQLIKAKTLNVKIFPVEEVDLESIYKFNLEDTSVVPDRNAFYRVVNKGLLFGHAKKNNIPCPQTIEAADLESSSILGKVVVKPARGMGSEGVRFFENYTDASQYINSLPDSKDILAQELVSTNNVRAGCFLFNKGEIVSFYGHERLRTYPKIGGVTVCSVSHQDKRIMELGERLLGPLNWSGLAMIEFMWSDVLNDYQLIEVNPRAWGSIMLSEKCDSNMLMSYVDLIFGKSAVKSIGKDNCYIRWLFPYDLINCFKGEVSISDYISMNSGKDCLINISYSNLFQSGLFHAFQFTQLAKIIKKFLPND